MVPGCLPAHVEEELYIWRVTCVPEQNAENELNEVSSVDQHTPSCSARLSTMVGVSRSRTWHDASLYTSKCAVWVSGLKHVMPQLGKEPHGKGLASLPYSVLPSPGSFSQPSPAKKSCAADVDFSMNPEGLPAQACEEPNICSVTFPLEHSAVNEEYDVSAVDQHIELSPTRSSEMGDCP